MIEFVCKHGAERIHIKLTRPGHINIEYSAVNSTVSGTREESIYGTGAKLHVKIEFLGFAPQYSDKFAKDWMVYVAA